MILRILRGSCYSTAFGFINDVLMCVFDVLFSVLTGLHSQFVATLPSASAAICSIV